MPKEKSEQEKYYERKNREAAEVERDRKQREKEYEKNKDPWDGYESGTSESMGD